MTLSLISVLITITIASVWSLVMVIRSTRRQIVVMKLHKHSEEVSTGSLIDLWACLKVKESEGCSQRDDELRLEVLDKLIKKRN